MRAGRRRESRSCTRRSTSPPCARQRLLKILTARGKVGDVTALLKGEYWRLRDVVVGPDGAPWVATSNRDAH